MRGNNEMGTYATFVACDLGAASGRVMVGQFDGNRLTISEVHRFVTTPVHLPDGWRTDVLHLFSEIKTGLTRAAEASNGVLAGIGVDTWGVDFALLDRHGALLANPYHYRDSLTEGILEIAAQRLSAATVFEQTGVYSLPINTLYQLYALKLRRAPVLDVAARLLMLPDLFNYWLTGRMVSEACIASTSQCYSLLSGKWTTSLLERFDLPTDILPEIVAPGTPLGELLPSLAAECNLQKSTPVFAPGCHDTALAVAAVPSQHDHFAYLSSGTWSLLGVELPAPCITPQSFAGAFTNEAGIGKRVRFLKNLTGLWLLQECHRLWQKFSYAELEHLASQAAPFRSLIDTQAPLFTSPGNIPARINDYCCQTGQRPPEGIAAITRCIFESLALQYRHTLEQIEAIVGYRPEPLHIIGGGAHNRLLCQFTANALNRPVFAGPIEATALGNILMQALAAGQIASLTEARAIMQRSCTPEVYLPEASAQWEEVYDRYKVLLATSNHGCTLL